MFLGTVLFVAFAPINPYFHALPQPSFQLDAPVFLTFQFRKKISSAWKPQLLNFVFCLKTNIKTTSAF